MLKLLKLMSMMSIDHLSRLLIKNVILLLMDNKLVDI